MEARNPVAAGAGSTSAPTRPLIWSAIAASLAALTFVPFTAATAQALEAPYGSYKDTCRDYRVEQREPDGPTLVGTCKKRDGGWKKSSLSLKICPARLQITNQDGNLSCVFDGSYLKTCTYLRINEAENVMIASCKRKDGTLRQTRLENIKTCKDGTVENLDGFLTCKR